MHFFVLSLYLYGFFFFLSHRYFRVQLSLILYQFVKMLVFYCKMLFFNVLHNLIFSQKIADALLFSDILINLFMVTDHSYERSKMPENQISELVTQTLAAVGLKVS